MATILAILGVITALAPVLFKVLAIKATREADENAKEKSLAKTEVDELDTSIASIDKRLRGD